jgi:hypothetical protein
MKASLERVAIGIVIVIGTGTGTETVSETETVDSMGGMEGLRRMDHLVEEMVSEEACQAEMIVEGLGAEHYFYMHDVVD